MDFDATMTPTDIGLALSLSDGQLYSGQNTSGTATLFLRSSASSPDVTDRAFRVQSGGGFHVRPGGDPVWLWTDDEGGCACILAESP